MDSDSEEENPDWNRFLGYIPHPEESHHWGECMYRGKNREKFSDIY